MTEHDDEVLRPVLGYEGMHEVSSLGRVRSLARTAPLYLGGTRTVPQKILKVNLIPGRAPIRLSRDGGMIARSLSEVVLEAFVGPCTTGQIVHYQDGDVHNCRLSNLAYAPIEWWDAAGAGPGPIPLRRHSTAKLAPLQARAIAASTERAVDLAARYGIANQTVDAIRQGRFWEKVTCDVRRAKRLQRPPRRLTEAEASEILASDEPGPVLMKPYGIHSSVLSTIRTGKSWKHLLRRSKTDSTVPSISRTQVRNCLRSVE